MGEPLPAEDCLATPCGTSLRHADPERHTPERLAVELGASDLFVFRRVTNSRFVHVGGAGRGKTWAGDIELDVDIDPLGLQLRIGEPLWIRHTELRHIFGPYYAAAAAAVRLSRDVLVIFGATSEEAASFELTSADLIDAANRAAGLVEAVSPAKHLADELEIAHARRALADRRSPGGSVAEALADVAVVAAEALSCEIAIAWLPDGRFHAHESGWTLPDRGALAPIMQELWDRRDGLPHCVQDAEETPLSYPLGPTSGVRSYYIVAIGTLPSALLLVAHTEAAPRGFTQLCRTLGEQLTLTADTGIANAALREQLLHAVAEESSARQELARLNTELADAALHDPLTGLPNRVLLQRHTTRLGRSHTPGCPATAGGPTSNPVLVYIDLDDFKSVNDDYGHAVGDSLLVEFARRLRESCRPDDVAARLAGDEFALLMVEPLTEAQALAVAGRVVQAASTPFLIADNVITIGASVGIAAFTTVDDNDDAQQSLEILLHRADLAMYRAKSRGRGRAEFFTERTAPPVVSQNRRWADDPAMGRRLRAALDDGVLTLRYQPTVDLLTGEVQGVEALVHWPQPRNAVSSPTQLIPLAERTGLIGPLGEWTIREACRQAASWNSHLPTDSPGLVMAVNISALQLRDHDFVELVTNIVAESGLHPDRLCMAITDTGLSADRDQLVGVLQGLHDAGVRLSVGGIGGPSSLTVMRHLPLDWVKIDRELVARVDIEPTDAVLVRLVIESAHSLGLRLCAEGVDRYAQLEQLTAMGCDAAQGHLLGGPVDPALLDTRTRAVHNLIVAGRPLLGGGGQLTTLVDAAGKFTYISAESALLLGYPPSVLIGRRALDLLPPSRRHLVKTRFRQGDSAYQVITYPLLRKDGAWLWVRATHQSVRDPNSQRLRHLAITAVEVTDGVSVESHVADRTYRLRCVFESAPHGIAVLTSRGAVLQVNAALLQLLGRTEADLLGHQLQDFTHPDDLHDYLHLLQTIRDGCHDEYTTINSFIHADGSPLTANVTVRLIGADDNHPPYVICHILPSSR